MDSALVNASQDEIKIPWLIIFLAFRSINAIIEEIALIDAYILLNSDEKCKKIYEAHGNEFKEKCTWEETQEMREYQRKIFKVRISKNIYSMAYDLLFMYFLMPKLIWEFLLWTFHEWGWCDSNWGPYSQLAVAIPFGLIYKLLDIVVHMPFGIYVTWWIEIPQGLSEATPCSYLWERFAMLLEFLLLNVPVLLIICLAAHLSGNWLWLVCLLTTGIFKILILYMYPVVIMPIFSNFSLLEELEEHKIIYDKIVRLRNKVGFPENSKIVLEESYSKDLHSNASTTANRIEIGSQLLRHHSENHEEILAILCHEFGHWKLNHLYRSIPIDTLYMVVFALYLMPLINNH